MQVFGLKFAQDFMVGVVALQSLPDKKKRPSGANEYTYVTWPHTRSNAGAAVAVGIPAVYVIRHAAVPVPAAAI